jgi:hypothetical protein
VLESAKVKKSGLAKEDAAVVDRLEMLAQRLCPWVDRYRYVFLGLYTVAYFGATCFRASRKLFWFDELFTLYLSQYSSLKSLWPTLLQGADFNPPLIYVLTHASKVIAPEEIGARLPQIIAFWIFTICLFQFVSERSNALGGFISLLLPLVSKAYFYASEARAHGIIAGCCGLIVVSWGHAAAKRTGRSLSLATIFIALTVGFLTHPSALVVLAPLFIAEVARFRITRRADPVMWTALIAPAVAGLVSVPILQSMQSFSRIATPTSTLNQAALWYHAIFHPAVTVFAVAIALFSLSQLTWKEKSPADIPASPLAGEGIKSYEVALLLGFLVLPFLVYFGALLTSLTVWQRYSIVAITGLTCFVGIACGRRASIGFVVLASLLVQTGADFVVFRRSTSIPEPSSTLPVSISRQRFDERYQWMLTDPHRDLPIVLLDDIDFAPTLHYAPESLRARLMYTPSTTAEIYERLSRCCGAPGRLFRLPEHEAPTGAWLAFGPARTYWLLHRWADAGATIHLEKIDSEQGLFLVNFPPARDVTASNTALSSQKP